MKNKHKTATFLRHLALTLMVAMLTAAFQPARAQDSYPEYITDLMLIGGTATTVNNLWDNTYSKEGWNKIDLDLNKGSGTDKDWIYLLYKKGSRESTNGGYITDLYITNKSASECLDELTFNDITYYRTPAVGDNHFQNGVVGDLNSSLSGSDDIHLYYTKHNFDDKRVISDIKILDGQGVATPDGYNELGQEGATTRYDLNKGAGGTAYIYLFYKTATKTNRPSSDPKAVENLFYNGDPQELLTIDNTYPGTMMYRVGEDGDFSSALPKATDAGSHTVYYYAAADKYGDKSETKSKAVSIKSWDKDADGNYLIQSVTELNALSTYVNNGHDCSGMSFKVTQDIDFNPSNSTTDNFKAIGNDDHKFNGHFDGNYKTISGIDIVAKVGYVYKGLFGVLDDDAVVEKIKLANTIITGARYIGGIAGENYGTIQNCTVESSVTINAINAEESTSRRLYFGGIVGWNLGIVADCISSVTLTASQYQCKFFGGIAGYNTNTLKDNLVINANIPAVDESYGAIVGKNSESLENNFYRNCKVGDTENATNVGCNKVDITSNYGAVSLHTITLCSGITTSTSATKTYNGTSYYAQGTNLALSYASGKHFLANGKLVNGTSYTMPAEDVTFTQCYAVINYTLNGGTLPSGIDNPTGYISGTLTLPTPTKNYYTFDGWYQGSTKKTTISDITADVTVTAKWTPIEYKITYTLNGGALPTGTANPTTYTVESSTITPPTPTRDGYDFGGWYDNNNFSGDPITSIAPATTHANTTLYAKWIKSFIIDGDSETSVAITETTPESNVLYLRNLKKGVTSTITLPFDFNASSMDGKFYQLTSVNTDDWTAGANIVTGTLSANTPYLFTPSKDIEQVEFTKVTLTPTTGDNSVKIDSKWTFHGVYEKILWETAPDNHYGFSAIQKGDDIAAGDFVKIGQYVRIKPTRAYLTYNDGISKSAVVLPDRIHVVFSDEEIASVIDPIDTPTDDTQTDDDITTPISEQPAQASNVKVWSYDKTIYIQAAPMTDYRIIDATGRVLRSATTQTDRDEIRLGNHNGIVIVIINHKTYKINY